MLSKKQAEFVAAIIQGTGAGEAYRQAFHPKTENADSLRAMASKERKKAEVAEAIANGLAAIAAEAIQGALWSERASIISRIQDIEAINAEIRRRLEGLSIEIEGINADETLSDAEKKQRIGKSMQRALIGRDLINAKQTIYAALDLLTASRNDTTQVPMFIELLNKSLENDPINPDDYTAPPPSGGYQCE